MPATGNALLDKGFKPAAGITFTKFRGVKKNANADEVTNIAASTDFMEGVAQYDCTAAEGLKGKRVSVRGMGRTEWEVSGAITRGQEVACDTDGRAKAAATGNLVQGVADQTATTAGQRITVDLNRNAYIK